MTAAPGLLTVADVARLRCVGRVAAYRWLHRNAARYLRRHGRFVVIAARDYAKVGRPPIDERIDGRLCDLESRVSEAEARLDVQHRALRNLHAI